jgi:hypothetical protein
MQINKLIKKAILKILCLSLHKFMILLILGIYFNLTCNSSLGILSSMQNIVQIIVYNLYLFNHFVPIIIENNHSIKIL